MARFHIFRTGSAVSGASSHNLSWSWSRDARALFRVIDQPLWHLTRHNPIELLRRVDSTRLTECAEDPGVPATLRRADGAGCPERLPRGDLVRDDLPGISQERSIAYFCAEFGLHNSVPIYSGGLGVLAGDHCKASSDLGAPLVGVGLLYTRGYFDQRLRLDGWQGDVDERFDATLTPLDRVLGPNGDPCLAKVPTGGRPVCVSAWRMMVGRVPVYLLDTDLSQNDPADRELCQRLYGGSGELRLRQEWVLGVGGVRVLRALGNTPAVWHANEGHAAFMLLERLRELVAGGVPFDDAVHQVRSTSVFTTHTPVPAGHDAFTIAQVEELVRPVLEEMKVSRDAVLHLGYSPALDHNQFHMPVLALRLSSRANGVSASHGEVSRRHVGRSLAGAGAIVGAHRPCDQRGASPHVDVAPLVGAARRPPRRRMDRAPPGAWLLAVHPDARRRGSCGRRTPSSRSSCCARSAKWRGAAGWSSGRRSPCTSSGRGRCSTSAP